MVTLGLGFRVFKLFGWIPMGQYNGYIGVILGQWKRNGNYYLEFRVQGSRGLRVWGFRSLRFGDLGFIGLWI